METTTSPEYPDILTTPIFTSLIRLCSNPTLDPPIRQALAERRDLLFFLDLISIAKRSLGRLDVLTRHVEEQKEDLLELLNRLLFQMVTMGVEEYLQDLDHPDNPYRSHNPEPATTSILRPHAPGRKRTRFLSPRVGRSGSSSSSAFVPSGRRAASPIDLSRDSPAPSISIRVATPEWMREEQCHGCGTIGHFRSWCPSYRCVHCDKTRPMHYASDCPLRRTPPPRGRSPWQESS